eukprot:1897635-Prorocentrum_lima.AAC.1
MIHNLQGTFKSFGAVGYSMLQLYQTQDSKESPNGILLTALALAIKWHTSENRWYRSPGKDKVPQIRSQARTSNELLP